MDCNERSIGWQVKNNNNKLIKYNFSFQFIKYFNFDFDFRPGRPSSINVECSTSSAYRWDYKTGKKANMLTDLVYL